MHSKGMNLLYIASYESAFDDPTPVAMQWPLGFQDGQLFHERFLAAFPVQVP